MTKSFRKREFERFVIEHSEGTIATHNLVWFNPSPDDHGFRLTTAAFGVLTHAEVKSYTYQIKDDISSRDLVDLDLYFNYPYFIFKHRRITVFAEEDAIILALNGGDLRSYLENLKNQ